MTSDTEELKPCPFCGEKPYIHFMEPHRYVIAKHMPDFQGKWYAECCFAATSDKEKSRAIALWNTRSTPDKDAQEALEALEAWVRDGYRFAGKRGELTEAEIRLCGSVPTIRRLLQERT